MKVVFFTNYMNHHQQFLSDAFYTILSNDFSFVATTGFDQERASFGYTDKNTTKEYIVRSYENEIEYEKSIRYAVESDYMIIGSAPDSYVDERLKYGKVTFRYFERYYKKGINVKTFPRYFMSSMKHIRKYQNKPVYYLCASAYTAADVNTFANFQNRTYKWGYFPEVKIYNIDDLMRGKQNKKRIMLLWAGRLIDWKHPQDSITIAKRLKDKGINFELNIIGNGELEEELRTMICDNNLSDCVSLLGSMAPEKVREYMELADIYLFTSDFNEGWGAVLNESMNSGCAVVVSHAVGSAPFLVENNENGLIYKSGDLEDLYQKVKYLIDNPCETERFGRNAYDAMKTMWNPQVAAERFLIFAKEIEEKGSCDLFEKGPCSRAEVLKNNWL